ncbi:MAG: DUF2298 domain-containing protein [Anaerolineales bacterium]|nr:DUF2298 domain-containing protein [Anaerolineales bacterium]
MITVIVWYCLITLLGWLVFPLTYKLFPSLADRGYSFSRILGLLLWGYAFWLSASLGLVRNDTNGLLFTALILLVINLWVLRRLKIRELVSWLKAQLSLVLHVEIVFLVAFLAWAAVRAANPEIAGTEKPMELAFINAILRSPTFPPHDPWLSGYAISYYYFGYVMVAMLARLSGVAGGVAFNLGICLVYALSAVGAYGVVYNLLSKSQRSLGKSPASLSVLSPFVILILGNLEGFLETLHARGLFWRIDASGESVSPFWKWLDLVELSQPPQPPYDWIPNRFWWWWRASRVIQDYDFQHNLKEVINEFPAFSYLLADLHPHVLAMPFAFLAMGLALQVFLHQRQESGCGIRLKLNLRSQAWGGLVIILVGVGLFVSGLSGQALARTIAGIIGWTLGALLLLNVLILIRRHGFRGLVSGDGGVISLGFNIGINTQLLFFGGLVLGGLGFLNTWDFPFYVALFAGAYALRKTLSLAESSPEIEPERSSVKRYLLSFTREFVRVGLVVGILGGILYLPFYIGFSSQAGGILPNIIYPTRGAHLWVVFAPLLFPLCFYLLFLRRKRDYPWAWQGLFSAGVVIVALWIFSLLFVWVIMAIPAAKDLYLSSLAAPGAGELLEEGLRRRLVNSGGWITLFLFLGGFLGFLLPIMLPSLRRFRAPQNPQSLSDTFVLFVCLLAATLVLLPEFFYLRDQFGWRINTIFKFYYQAWLMWGIAAAYSSALLLRELSRLSGWLHKAALVFLFGMALTFTVLGVLNKTNGFWPAQGWTLDGVAYLERQSPDMMAAVRWLQSASPGVVAEAVSPSGGSYTHYASISMLSGQPAVLGWVGHESQWRGGSKEMGSRQADVELLYCTRSWDEAKAVIDIYNIRYVYVGSLERATYAPGQGSCASGLYEVKFRRYMTPVFEQGDSMIYMVR